MPWRFSHQPRNQFVPQWRWEHFDAGRTLKAAGNYLLLYEHFTSIAFTSGSSHREIIEKVAASSTPPIPIDLLDECLNLRRKIRGGVIFGWTGDQIDQLVSNYPGLRWWMSKKGLVISMVGPEDRPISDFDRKAGQLWLEHSINGRLHYPGLVRIAKELDLDGFQFKENLEAAQWSVFAEEAERTKKPAPKTFSEAVASPKHQKRNRAVRLRLLRAKGRYQSSIYGAVKTV